MTHLLLQVDASAGALTALPSKTSTHLYIINNQDYLYITDLSPSLIFAFKLGSAGTLTAFAGSRYSVSGLDAATNLSFVYNPMLSGLYPCTPFDSTVTSWEDYVFKL